MASNNNFNYEGVLAKDRHEKTLRDLIQILNTVQIHVPAVPAADGIEPVAAHNESILERLGDANLTENIRRLQEPERGIIQRSNFQFEYAEQGIQRNMEGILTRLTNFNAQFQGADVNRRTTLNAIVYKISSTESMFNDAFDTEIAAGEPIPQRWVRVQQNRTMDQFFQEAGNVVWLDTEQKLVDYQLT